MNDKFRQPGSGNMDAVWRKLDDHSRKFEHLEGQQDDQFRSLGKIETEVEKIKVDIGYMREGVQAVKELTATINRWKGLALALIIAAQLLGPSLMLAVRVAIFGTPPSKGETVQQTQGHTP